MTEVTEEMKKRIAELCAMPVEPDEESWNLICPDFAKHCNYVPEKEKKE